MFLVNIHEARTNLSKLVKKVMNGEEVVIAKGNKPVVKMVQYNTSKLKREIGTAKGQVKIAPDFDKPLDDFKEYM